MENLKEVKDIAAASKAELVAKLAAGEGLTIVHVVDNEDEGFDYDRLYIPDNVSIDDIPDRWAENEDGDFVYDDWEEWLNDVKKLGLISVYDMVNRVHICEI